MMAPTQFAYRGVRRDGLVVAGTLRATDDADVRALLGGQGILAFEVMARHAGVARAGIGPTDLALGLRILADLIGAGLPVSRALQVFEELAPRGWRAALPSLRQSVREGHSFAAALASAPVAIPDLIQGIVHAGEAGAGLGPALAQAAILAQSTAETRASIWAALAYPMIVACAGAGAIVVLLTVVLPRFAKILADLGQTLPASTRIVIAVASIAHAVWLPALGAAVACLAAWRAWVHTAAGRERWHRWLIRAPIVGEVRVAAGTSRMAFALGALLESGVAIGPALALSARASGDAELRRRLLAARLAIATGTPLSRAIDAERAASRIAIRLIRAGEETGRLADMLRHAAELEQQRSSRALRAAIRMLEPLLLLTFASIVGLIAAALLQAIYSVRPAA